MEIKIYTDASYRSLTNDGCYGYIILKDDLIQKQFCRTTYNIKINCLEFMAIKLALYDVYNEYLRECDEVDNIDLYTDSVNCIKYIENFYQLKHPLLKEIKKEVDELLEIIEKSYDIKVKFHHVPSHSPKTKHTKSELNNMIDKFVTTVSKYNRDLNRKINNEKN